MTNETTRTHVPMDVQPQTHINAPVNVHGWCFGLIPANGNWLDDIIDWPKRQFRHAAVARRMAACWNACSGIATEDLAARRNISAANLAGERAKLLKALENARSTLPTLDVDSICRGFAQVNSALQVVVDSWTSQFERQRHLAPQWVKTAREALELKVPVAAPQHPDDIAIDWFADAMKEKMAKQRTKGYSGWENTASFPADRLQQLLAEHVNKGDPVDVGNYAMMLWNRGEKTAAPRQEAQPAVHTVTGLIYPATMTPLLEHVLGFPNFRTGPIAHVFQKAGFAIKKKCEAEQAFVLDRMIRAVLEHGEKWAEVFESDLRAQFDASAGANKPAGAHQSPHANSFFSPWASS